MPARQHNAPAADAADARQRLIAAGIELFGRNGFDAASTRDLAQEAGVNIAGIAYHFGGKEGLYTACADHIATLVRQSIGIPAGDPPDSPSAARDAIAAILSTMARLMAATPELETNARFLLREHMDPTPAFDILHDSLLRPVSAHLCRLWSVVTGADPESEETRLTVFGLIGQILIFRVAQTAACRRLGWPAIGARECAAIENMVVAALDALIAQRGKTP